jgi:hypothetical protein
VSQDAFSDLPLRALAELPRQAVSSLDVSELAMKELRRALLCHLPDTGQEVMDDLIIIGSREGRSWAVILDHEERLFSTRLRDERREPGFLTV